MNAVCLLDSFVSWNRPENEGRSTSVIY